MSENYCPQCDAPLGPETMNIAEGVALCPECGKLSPLSEVVEATTPLEELVENPPAGCTISEWGDQTTLYANLRSGMRLLGTLFAATFWNGITSIFLLKALTSLYHNLIGPLPDWVPTLGDAVPLGTALLFCLFLIPFVLIGAAMIFAIFCYAWGRIEITVDRHEAKVRTGFGPFNWTQRFDPDQVEEVDLGFSRWASNGQHQEQIEIHADRKVNFGSMLSEERREWLYEVLRAKLLRRDPVRI
jgi:hypothetical protein